jgi:hypothetical protein
MDHYVFKGLLFPVFDYPETTKLLERFPQLAQWPEFKTPTRHDINKVIRYIVCMYDKNGICVYETNGFKRKRISAELAGWKPDKDGDFRGPVKEMMDGYDEPVNLMIIRYCKLQRSARYSTLVGIREVYYSILEKMIRHDDISAKESQMFEDYEKKIDIRAMEFLNGDMGEEIREDMYQAIEYEKLELRPEDIAEKIKEGKLPVKVFPYGEDYSAGKRKLKKIEEDMP